MDPRSPWQVFMSDNDVVLFDDPYAYFKAPPFSRFTVINQQEVQCGDSVHGLLNHRLRQGVSHTLWDTGCSGPTPTLCLPEVNPHSQPACLPACRVTTPLTLPACSGRTPFRPSNNPPYFNNPPCTNNPPFSLLCRVLLLHPGRLGLHPIPRPAFRCCHSKQQLGPGCSPFPGLGGAGCRPDDAAGSLTSGTNTLPWHRPAGECDGRSAEVAVYGQQVGLTGRQPGGRRSFSGSRWRRHRNSDPAEPRRCCRWRGPRPQSKPFGEPCGSGRCRAVCSGL